LGLSRLGKSITENLGLKIVSLLLAVILWLYVTAQQIDMQVFRVPIELKNIPEGLALSREAPSEADVTIKGARIDLIKLRLTRKLKLSVDCSDVKAGRVNIRLSPAALNLPQDFDIRNVSIDNPHILSLEFEKLVSKQVPVKIAYKGEVPENIVIEGKPIIVPDRVTVTGPERVINKINLVNTEEIELKGSRKKFSSEVRVNAGTSEIDINPKEVFVEIRFSRRILRVLSSIPPTLLQDDQSLAVKYSPRTVSLTVEGPEELVNSIRKEDISIIIDITTKKEGKYKIEPQIIVPKGIDRYWLDIDYFDIEISKKNEEGS